MHPTECTRLLIWFLCLYFTQGEVCSNTQKTGNEYMDIRWNDCYGAQYLRLFKGNGLVSMREYFEGVKEIRFLPTNEKRYLYFVNQYDGFWGIGSSLGNENFVHNTAIVNDNSLTVPAEVYWNSWRGVCNGAFISTNMRYTRTNCYDCGLNKITTPPSNTCFCRVGQQPRLNDGVCVNCPANTYKSYSDNWPCTSCGDDEISPAGSTSYSNCVCGLQKIRHPGSNICQCRAGQSQGYDLQGICENCPINTYKESISDDQCNLCSRYATSPAGSTSSRDCVCLLGKIMPADSYICFCRAGQYPGLVDGVCGNCPINTYKESPSDAACTLCVDYSTSLEGSTSVGDCLCNPGFTKTGDGTCAPCDSGTFKPGVSDDDCTPCPVNSFSAAGSTACQCKNGFSGVSDGVCSMCSGGKYSVAT